MLNTKTKLIVLFIALAVGSLVYFKPKIENKFNKSALQNSQTEKTQNQQDESPRIISTKPDPLDETIVPATQVIEITFNKPLQNVPEFKLRIEPKYEYNVELSSDRKTAKIIPLKSLELGAAYTLYIGRDTKFEKTGEWGKDQTFRFRTVKYRGV